MMQGVVQVLCKPSAYGVCCEVKLAKCKHLLSVAETWQ